VLTSLEAALNDPQKRPSFIDSIKITEMSMGEEFPIFSNVRVVAVEDDTSSASSSRLQALVDVDLSDDNLTLAVETSLILNYPKPLSAILPVALSVSVVRFSGTLSISFIPAPEEQTEKDAIPTGKPKTSLAFSFLPDYRMDLSVRSLIGSRSRLQDIPKVAQLVEARAQAWFEERVVEPRVQVVPLPGIWPRMGKVRVRESQDDERPSSQASRSQATERKRSDHFPSQEEAERLFEGLRWRAGQSKERSNSQVILNDDDYRMPGSLPS
jgi:maintenance of morphology protein 1